MTDLSAVQGELLALRCHIAALIEVLPLSAQLRFIAELETCSALPRPCQPNAGQAAFDRAMISLRARRRFSSGLLPLTANQP